MSCFIKLLRQEANVAINSILAGICIGIGCTVNLMIGGQQIKDTGVDDEGSKIYKKVSGSLFFGLGKLYLNKQT